MAIKFGQAEAAHLLRRAAARGRKNEVEQLVSLGLNGAVEALLRTPATPPMPKFDVGDRANVALLVSSWLNWWLQTPTPAAERLVLFWHGHFVSEIRDVRSPHMMWGQFQTFREKGLGSFRDLLNAVAKDPAMLVYLDNATSRKEHPNENWARELLELFTVGVGHYTEKDILESARAFTGWTVRPLNGARGPDAQFGPFEFVFNQRWHDTGNKQYLGYNVKTGEDVLNVLANHEQTYRYVGRKLLAFYFNPNPSYNMVEEAAKVLRSSGTKGFLQWLFTHEAFYAPDNRNVMIKSPVEYIVGLTYAAGGNQIDNRLVQNQTLTAMGQVPFQPPSVKGWDGGMTWLAETPFLTRLNILSGLAGRERNLDLSVFMDEAQGALALVKPEAQLL